MVEKLALGTMKRNKHVINKPAQLMEIGVVGLRMANARNNAVVVNQNVLECVMIRPLNTVERNALEMPKKPKHATPKLVQLTGNGLLGARTLNAAKIAVVEQRNARELVPIQPLNTEAKNASVKELK